MSDTGSDALGGRLKLLRREASDHIGFDLLLDKNTYIAADPTFANSSALPTVRLFEIQFAAKRICVYPVSTLPTTRFLKPKYPRIRSICVDYAETDATPEDTSDAIAFLQEFLPLGFIKDPGYGLGLIKETKPLITAIEDIPSIAHLSIASAGITRIEGNTFHLNGADYDRIRLAFHRIAVRYQMESFQDRSILAHNELLHSVAPTQFPLKERPYKPGTVFKLMGGRAAASITLKGKDRKSAIDVITSNAKQIEEHDPQEFAQLQKDIELVSLDKLIEQYRRALTRNRAESEWQKLFELNPFILSMVFGYPIVVVQPAAFVGGLNITGSGNKIADFLVKNTSTHNAALVEIKKPATPLFGREYRTGVWAPSGELSGAIVQVLDQRQKLMTHIAQLRYASRDIELDAIAVDCVIVAGKSPGGNSEIASFELIRSQFKDVRVITFDELLEKLILLREMLSGERYLAPPLEDASDDDSLVHAALIGEAEEPEEDDDF
jgi:hypothetical protein